MKKALITDVDNTLFDWVDVWYKSFSAMMNKVEEISGISASELYPSISKIHQKYKTSEYAFLLEAIPELIDRYGPDVNKIFEPAIYAYRKTRKEALCLYPGVLSTLKTLGENNIILVAYTESMSFYTNYRFRKLGLDEIFDFLYSPPDHQLPDNDLRNIRRYSDGHYAFKKTVHRHTPEGELKPNPHILSSILQEIGVTSMEAVYVGDSLMKDIAMAQQAKVLDVLAAYGAAQHRDQYELLKKVTHWSPADVEREKTILAGQEVKPSIVLNTELTPILAQFGLETDSAR